MQPPQIPKIDLGEIEVQANLDNEFKLIHPALGIVDDVEDKIKESARFVCPRGRSYAEQFTCECTHESCSNVMACFYSKLPNLKAYVDCLPKPVPLRLSRPVCGKCSRYQTTFCTFDDLRDAITRDDVACTDFEAYPTRRRR
jgi:hypothetical protein